MIYLVTGQAELFKNDTYKIISIEESLELLSKPKLLQYDSETTGLDPYFCRLRVIQFGSDEYNFQIVVDVETISVFYYKEILENKILLGHNIKFDLKFLYTLGIIPTKVYDTMIIEQLLYLGYNFKFFSTSLQSVAWRRLSIVVDKDVRANITTRPLDDAMIFYSAKDVEYLEKIVAHQKIDLIKQGLTLACDFECKVIPVMAYLEWCGIKLDVAKWQAKMIKDNERLEVSTKALNSYVESNPSFSKWTKEPVYYDLFEEVDFSPKCIINWKSSKQVIPFVQELGFDTKVVDKKTKKEKDSVESKVLATQKGINDTFLKLYLDYKEATKVVESFGQVFIDSINPITNRLHTDYKQLGTRSGRMSSGGGDNLDLSRYKKLKPGSCKNSNHQQLPSDHDTRSSFVSEKGNLFCSCDYSA